MFYEFSQNNSGGSFDFDERSGITHVVIIEAESPEEANTRAESIGLYWDGCDDGRDCPCCGDRWYPKWHEAKGYPEPTAYEKPVTEAEGYHQWMDDGKEIAVHFKDGRIEWHGITPRK